MGFSIIATGGGQSTNTTSVTTSAIDCTGANLILLAVASSVWASISVTDSQSNTYTLQATHGGAGFGKVAVYSCFGPSVTSSMTFTVTTTSGTAFPSVAVLAVSGASSGSVDQQTGADSAPFTATSTTAGPITPTQNDELWVSALNTNSTSGTPSNGTGTLAFAVANAATAYGLGMAYGIQTTATAQSCGWSWSTASVNQTVIASFPASATIVSAQGLCRTAGYAIGIIQGTAQGRSVTAGHTAASIQAIAAGLCRTAGHSGGSAIVTNAQGRSYAAGYCLANPPAVAANGLCRTAGYVTATTIKIVAQGRSVCAGRAFGTPSAFFASGLCRTAGYAPAADIEATAQGHTFCRGYTATTPAIVALAEGRCHAAGYVSGTAAIKASAQGRCHAAGYSPLLNGAAETCLEGPIAPKPFVAGIAGNVSY